MLLALIALAFTPQASAWLACLGLSLFVFGMALNARTRVISRNDALDAAFPAALNSGFLRIYDGSQPTDANTALGAQVLLAELTLNATAFAAASAGAKVANAITSDTSANATGTATWGTLVTSGGTRYMDFEVGTSGANLNLNTVSIVSGATVSVTALTITQAIQ
jgi:mRNA-degrading endonuclease toxin of MazEF toxin-antitoxin module